MTPPRYSVHAEPLSIKDSAFKLSESTLKDYDCLVLIYTNAETLQQFSIDAVSQLSKINLSFSSECSLIHSNIAPGNRLVLSPTAGLSGDTDDVRLFGEAAGAATRKAIASGANKILIHIVDPPTLQIANGAYRNFAQVALLGCLDVVNSRRNANTKVGIMFKDQKKGEEIIKVVVAIEEGRILARKIGTGCPEEMAPPKFAEAIMEAFKNEKAIKSELIQDYDIMLKEYPLLAAVGRSASKVHRHNSRIVKLEYKSPDQSKVKENLSFIGKGITLDTGGLDIKAGGGMRGMSRDCLGAGSVAALMLTIAKLQPEHINVSAKLAIVRNNTGSEAYSCDEVITSRAGKRVLVGNTDAEGRMVMTDLLCEAKEEALESMKKHSVPHRLFTVATLTGHACIAFGPYSTSLSNGPASADMISHRLAKAGHVWGDPFEISTLRREDFSMVRPGNPESEDVVQANTLPTVRTARGHQYPAAFMIIASGLENHQGKIGYTHCDIAGAAEDEPIKLSLGRVNARPVPALVGAFVIPEGCQ
ncbi:putative aminopeptidase W07G4.4 [Neolecta irregularis DAH-3]|uniref:Putative aminopeptidase W07G4.4 n=1 Tax=Neolecta irregularis (strain DAH-3) TaxID=1198029 RepID=A0A1U7LRR8_NEOID|nr:putative aminopeptidase W07G4.4 [Neolecta irregularis DAH-3]|eukprot:OLL25366.1 putative aminopeptidase W07G4.4 [Neolecta irregularis DAH-3]